MHGFQIFKLYFLQTFKDPSCIQICVGCLCLALNLQIQPSELLLGFQDAYKVRCVYNIC